MARSSYIWIVVSLDGYCKEFTVKHEMVSWLHRGMNLAPVDYIIRVRDGIRDAEAKYFDLSDIIPPVEGRLLETL